MSNVKIVLNRAGVRELLRSPEMAAMLKERADSIKDSLPDGYVSRSYCHCGNRHGRSLCR